MRTEIEETNQQTGIAGSRRSQRAARMRGNAGVERLEPAAVDAAFEDEAFSELDERTLRRDGSHAESGFNLVALETMSVRDAQILHSLSTQLDLLRQQQSEIQVLLDRAGHRRIDQTSVR